MPATFHFFLRDDRPDHRDECPLYLRITLDRKHRYTNTGIRLNPKHWNPDKEEIRRSHRTYKKINQELDVMRENAGQVYRELDRDNRASAAAIKTRLEYSSKDDFFQLADELMDRYKNERKYWTRKQTKAAVDKFRQFHKSDSLPVNSIDPDMLTEFQSHLKSINKASTIRKNMGCIKKILELAELRHLIPENPMETKSFKLIKKGSTDSKTKLSYQQIQTFEKLQLEKGSNLWHARNAFVLSFYFCGMRFGDLAELKWENVKNGRLVYSMNKTGNPINIPIGEGSRRILDYYGPGDKDEYILPFLNRLSIEQRNETLEVRQAISSANAIVNGQNSDGKRTGLKEIAEKAGIDENISMHVARHSFAQYGVNDKNIPPYKMMMLLGHKNIKTTMQYLKSLDVKTVDTVMEEIF